MTDQIKNRSSLTDQPIDHLPSNQPHPFPESSSPVPPIVVVERSQSAGGAFNYTTNMASSASATNGLLSPGPLADGSSAGSPQTQAQTPVATTSLYVPQVTYAPDVRSWWNDQSIKAGQKKDFSFDEDIIL